MPVDLFSLEGKGALVTGAGSGLGRAIALGVSRAGASVVCADLNRQAASETVERIRDEGGRAWDVEVDVGEASEVERMVQEAMQWLAGKLDISYHMAGVNVARKPALELGMDELQSTYRVNVAGLLACCQAVGRVMVARGRGSIVNAASIMSTISTPKNLAYSSSKAAVASITRTLALEWASQGVRVNALAPAYMRTPLIQQILSDEAWTRRIEARSPMGRMGEPDEIVGPAIFLGSDASSFVTGTLLFVDGGWTAM